MIRLSYDILVDCSTITAFDRMLGLSNVETYQQWTSVFSPTSSYEGDWKENGKMLFTSLNKEGKKEGMVSKILKLNENAFVSIQHIGMLKDGKEIVDGPEIDSWAGGLENYSFKEEGSQTRLTVEVDTLADYKEYMDKLYPKALEKLKEVCESSF